MQLTKTFLLAIFGLGAIVTAIPADAVAASAATVANVAALAATAASADRCGIHRGRNREFQECFMRCGRELDFGKWGSDCGLPSAEECKIWRARNGSIHERCQFY
jgi:hypothetical protein